MWFLQAWCGLIFPIIIVIISWGYVISEVATSEYHFQLFSGLLDVDLNFSLICFCLPQVTAFGSTPLRYSKVRATTEKDGQLFPVHGVAVYAQCITVFYLLQHIRAVKNVFDMCWQNNCHALITTPRIGCGNILRRESTEDPSGNYMKLDEIMKKTAWLHGGEAIICLFCMHFCPPNASLLQ